MHLKSPFIKAFVFSIASVLILISVGGCAQVEKPQTAVFTPNDTYLNHCAVCHGNDGSGTELGPNLHKPLVQTKTAESLAEAITHGSEGMPGMDKQLDAAEIVELVKVIQPAQQ